MANVRIIILEERSYQEVLAGWKELLELSKNNPHNLSIVKEIGKLRQVDTNSFKRYVGRIYGLIKDGKTIRNITVKGIRDEYEIKRRRQRASDKEQVRDITGKGFGQTYEENIILRRELEKEVEDSKNELKKSREELDVIQNEAITLAMALAKGRKFSHISIVRMMNRIKEMTSNFRKTEDNYDTLYDTYKKFMRLFYEAHEDRYKYEKQRGDSAIRDKERIQDIQSRRMGTAGRKTDRIYSEDRKKLERTLEIRNMEFSKVNIQTMIKAANDVATMQLDVPGIFHEILKGGLLVGRLFNYIERLKGTEKEKHQKFYKEIMLGIIEMIKNVVKNYPKKEEIMDKDRLLAALNVVDLAFGDELEEYIEEYKKGDLVKKAKKAWEGKQTIFHTDKGQEARDKLQTMIKKTTNPTNLAILKALVELEKVNKKAFLQTLNQIEPYIKANETIRITTPEKIRETIRKSIPDISDPTTARKTRPKKIILIKKSKNN